MTKNLFSCTCHGALQLIESVHILFLKKTENVLQLHPSESLIREPEVFVSILTCQSCIINPSHSRKKEPGSSYKHPKDKLATTFLENDSEESAV